MSLDLINKNALDIFNNYGYPSKKNEDWKYTNLKKFKSLNFSKPKNFISSKKKYNFDDLGITTINIINNTIIFKNEPSILRLKKLLNDKNDKIYNKFFDINTEIAQSNPFFVLNSANFNDGILIKINNNMKNVLINLIGNNKIDSPEAYFNRIHIEVAKNCNSNIYLNSYGEKKSNLYYKNTAITVDLNENSQINMTNVYEESSDSYSFNSLIINQKKYSSFNGKSYFLKSNFIRNDIVNNLSSEGCHCNLDGLFLGTKNEFIDNNIKINHNSQHTTSKVLYKGVLDDKSKAVFNAQVNVPFKSKKIDSDQKNHNILLSNTAKINSNPKLKISCDDVKCSHGSTIGNLDKDSLFYLRSRGIDLNKSKKILLKSFMNDIIDKIDKFEYLIEIGKENKGLADSDKTNENLIIGCASKSWITCTSKDLYFDVKVDSEAHIVRGLLTILQIAVKNKTKDEIFNINGFELLNDIGIGNNITSQRMNGFLSALKKIKDLI